MYHWVNTGPVLLTEASLSMEKFKHSFIWWSFALSMWAWEVCELNLTISTVRQHRLSLPTLRWMTERGEHLLYWFVFLRGTGSVRIRQHSHNQRTVIGWQCYPFKRNILNFHPLEVVGRGRVKITHMWNNLSPNISKFCCVKTHFIPNKCNLTC